MLPIADGICWTIGLAGVALLRFDLDSSRVPWTDLLRFAVIASVLQFAIGRRVGLYRNRWKAGFLDEVLALGATFALTGAVITGSVFLLDPRPIPFSVAMGSGVLAMTGSGFLRVGWRLVSDAARRPRSENARPVIIFGAGDGGLQVIRAMLQDPQSPYLPVALLDDDPEKHRLRIRGVPVRGGRDALAEVAAETGARLMVIAAPRFGASLIRELSRRAADCGLEARVLPPVDELFGSTIGLSDIRPVTEQDLLGRHAVDTDIDAIAGYLTGRRVLLTGAGGSIGSELARQITRFAPGELILLERDESALHAVQLSIEGRAMLDAQTLVVADIRDRDRIFQVFDQWKPEVVFHAAALKHLPLLEMHPDEGVKTNVWGTKNLLDASVAHGVGRFVNISTDKAADPTSVLGYTKRLAERLTAEAGVRAAGEYMSVRFGNVLGSRGSVLTAFRAQIDAGGPVTVTHPEVTRYFMLVEEAAQLVVQAGAIGHGGKALVLDMGEAVKIDDVARQLIANADRDIDIVYTGLRPGEKLHEVLQSTLESPSPSGHPLISQVNVPAIGEQAIRDALASSDCREAIERLCSDDVEADSPAA